MKMKLIISALIVLLSFSAATTVQAAYDPNRGQWLSRDPLPDAERSQGPNLYEYVMNEPLRFNDPLGLWTYGVGGSVNFQIGLVNINFSGGLVIDGEGNVGTFEVAGGGAGVGANASGGIQFSGSTAPSICDLRQGFKNFNLGGGWGPDVEANTWNGSSPDGPVTGWGATIGPGLGGGGSGGGTYTWVQPFAKW